MRIRALLFICALAGGIAHGQETIFASYNLENYFQASDFPDGTEKISKSPASIEAEVQVIAAIKPDILGVCEMGPPAEFADFRARLKAAGLDFADAEYVAGPDPERHLALLSRYPIVERHSLTDAGFPLDGHDEKVRRGILDVTLNIGGTKVRFMGVHLKSKLRDTVENEAEIRRNEAHLLRGHIDDVLAAAPDTKLVVYGDFNDTKNEAPLRDIMHGGGSGMRDLLLKDSDGLRWTEYWSAADEYSRIDYIMVSRGFYPAVDMAHSYVYRGQDWYKASDHRPVVAALRLEGAQ